MTTILDRIVAHKKAEVAAQKQRVTTADLQAQIAEHNDQPRGFMQALRAKIEARQNAVIAEIKKASPSLGVIRADFNPVAIAEAYESNGATCLSVLTDAHFFQGQGQYIAEVRAVSALPVLRKDFTIDAYQVLEARALGADAVLLIAAILTDAQMLDFANYAQELGMDVLVEVHDAAEFERALALPVQVVGVNNRNLHDFSVSLQTSVQLRQTLPEGYCLISESGIGTHDDIVYLNEHEIYAFLVGGALMQADDPGVALNALLTGRK